MNKSIVASVVGLALLGSVGAAQAKDGTTFDYVGVSFVEYGVDQSSSLSGYAFDVSKTVNETMFLRGDYQSASESGVSIDMTRISIGFRGDISETVTGYAGVGFAHAKIGNSMNSVSDDGITGFAGLASRFTPLIEGYAELVYTDVLNVDETELTFGSRFHVSEHVSLALSYSFGEDADTLRAGIIIRF